MAIDDLSFCSSCLICAKLCVHPKARLKLNDCNLPAIPAEISKTKTLTNNKKTVTTVNKKQILAFKKCVSKFCELFNSPPADDDFAKDFSDFFRFTTLSGKCPVCENCQDRIRLISKVIIQIEALQAQLMTLKKSVENDIASTNLTSPHRSNDYARNKVNKRFIVDIDTKARVFREQLRRKLQDSLTAENHEDIDDEVDAVTSDPNNYPILLEDANFETHENDNGISLYRDDEHFDIKPDPDDGEDLNDSVDDVMDFCDEKPEWENESELDGDTQNEIRDGTNIYASVEIKGATCTLTLSNLEEPVVIDNSLNGEDFHEMQDFRAECLISQPQTQATFSAEEFTSDNSIVFTSTVNRPGAQRKSLKMNKKGSSGDKRKILKCTFVDPVKGKCRVKVLDQDRMNAHINRTHKYIPQNKAYECKLCPFSTGSIKHLNVHRERHAGSTDTTSETAIAIPDTDCHDQIEEPSEHQSDETASEIKLDFDADNQSSDSADVNLIAGITNSETEVVAHTLTLNQLEEPTDFLELKNTEKVQVSVSKTNRRKSTSQARPDSDFSLTETKSDSSIRIGRPPKVKVKRAKPLKKCTRDTGNLVRCTHVDPVKGQCFWKFLDQDRLDAHIRRHHQKIPEGKSFQCNLCPFATGDVRYLIMHRKRHAGIKDVTCEICGRSFLSERYLVKHKRARHDEHYPLHCNICKKGCHNSYDLKMHNYQSHGEGEFTHRCLICKEGFYTLHQLNTHMVKHAEPTFKCDVCPKAFRTKALLKRHAETHTGIRPFDCDLCSWKFYTQQKLDFHRSIHTKKRPFLCQECGFSCRLPELLTSHLKVHENNKSLAEKGIKKLPRLAKPRNRRIKIFKNTIPPTLPMTTQTTTELLAESIAQQPEAEIIQD